MISGLPLEYASARVWTRLSERPDEKLWQQARAAKSLPSLAEAVRASRTASMVSGIPRAVDADAIELAFRQQLRTRIDELARWSPEPWQGAVSYTRHLVDLPALLRLMSDEPPPRWMAADPELARYVHPRATERRGELRAGPLAEIAADIDGGGPRNSPSAAAATRARPAAATIHLALAAWERAWRARWPRVRADGTSSLEELVGLLRRHLLRFGSLPQEETAAARHALADRLAAFLRRAADQPAALFAYVALLALDLERLRAQFVRHARLGSMQAVPG